jgi:peptidoglycan/LPS O-acetylase OafA/YrhL
MRDCSSSETPPPGAKEHERLRYLDGLRGWAAVSVLIFHSTWELFGHVVPGLAGGRLLLNDGPLAIYVFFVLSGFVLSTQYLSSNNLQRLRATALGRYLRLTIPIAAAALVSFILLKCGAMLNQEASAIVARPDWLGSFYAFSPSFFSYFKFSFYDVYFAYDPAKSYDVFLWTMPIELTGSFLIFAIVALFGTSLRPRLISCAVAIFLCSLIDQSYLTFLYGYLLAILHARIDDKSFTKGVVGNVIGLSLVALVWFYRSGHDDVGTGALLGAGLVLAPVFSPFLRRVLTTTLSKWLGRLSFPLYLVHSAVICSLSSLMIIKLHQLSWSPSAMAAVVVPSTVVASLLTARLFEPIERLAIRSSRRFAELILQGRRYVLRRGPHQVPTADAVFTITRQALTVTRQGLTLTLQALTQTLQAPGSRRTRAQRLRQPDQEATVSPVSPRSTVVQNVW